jgi:hypothetical protein
MRERWRPLDVLVQLLGVAVGIVAGAAIGEVAGDGWRGVSFFGGFIAGNAGVKALQPSNTVLKNVSWVDLLAIASMMLAVAYLLDNPQVLGSWTIIVVFGALFVYGLISLVVSTRTRAKDDGASDDRAD